MRTLNRPMFRYGGPIKEGVMNGIREPKRNGGSMTQRVQPSNDGSRPGYAGPALLAAPAIGAGIMTAARAGLRYIPRGINYLKNLARTKTGEIGPGVAKVRTLPPGTAGRNLSKNIKTVPKQGPGQAIYEPNFLGRDPTVRLVGGIYRGVTSPQATGVLQKGAQLVFSPTGAATGIIYFGGKYYNQKTGKETKKPKGSTLGVNTPSGNNPFGYEDDPLKTGSGKKELTEAEKAKIESDNRIKQMDKYREIMDIKGMSKDAAYKSLIDAGKIIQEGGNLKEQLKSGKLIQNLTAAASKRFDKVGDTEAALRSLVVKGEIDKEMNKEDKALTRQLKKTQIKLAEKGLAGDSFEEAILKSITGQQGKMPTGNKLAGILKATRGIDSIVLDGSGMSKPGDEIKFLETQVSEGIKKGNVINPGAYVINSKILIIDENNNVTQYY
jgi:hypothetical protein